MKIHNKLMLMAIEIGCLSKFLSTVPSLNNLNMNRIRIPNMKGSEGKLTPKLKSGLRILTDSGVAKTMNHKSLSNDVK
jgi:hypothetical protein